MGDDVVELTGDAGSLVAHRGKREYLPLLFQLAERASSSVARRRREPTNRPPSQGAIVTISKSGLKPLSLVVLTPTTRLASPISDRAHRQLAPRLYAMRKTARRPGRATALLLI